MTGRKLTATAVGRFDGVGARTQGHASPGSMLARPHPWALMGLIQLAARTHLGRIRVLNGDRLPRRGPVLLVANHPSTWTDAIVLDVALGRTPTFLVQEALFRPWPRGLLLRLHGALPAWPRGDPDSGAANARTFELAAITFRSGGWIAIFPEGTSHGDHVIGALRTGAARLALGFEAQRPKDRLTLLPVGLHYEGRSAFRTEVTVVVGLPVPIPRATPDDADQVRELTERVGDALRELVIAVPDDETDTLLSELARVHDTRNGGTYERWSRLSAWAASLREHHPAVWDDLRRRARMMVRARKSLGVSARALRARGPRGRRSPGRFALAVLGVPAAAIGALYHAAPWYLTVRLARRLGPTPALRSFARVSVSLVVLPLYYLATGVWIALGTRVTPMLSLFIVVGLAALGRLAYAYAPFVSGAWEGFRLRRLERLRPAAVTRARAAVADLVTRTAGAWDDRSPPAGAASQGSAVR